MVQFLNSISDVAKNYKAYDKWEQKQADLEAKKTYLDKKAPLDDFEKQKLKQKAERVIRITEKMDARSEDNAQDVEMLTETATMAISIPALFGLTWLAPKLTPKFQNSKAGMMKGSLFAQGIIILGTLLIACAGILWSNSKTKEASRLGRYQAKVKDLKDAKNFVQYTPEQIEEAKKIAQNMPIEKKKNSIVKAYKNVLEMWKDNKAYKNHKKEIAQKNNEKQNTDFTPSKEQLSRAKADKTLLQTIIKKINNKAEDYTENTENAFDTLKMTSFLATIPLGLGLNKLFKALKLNIPRTKVSTWISIAFPLIVSLYSLKAEKTASRVGRFKAKQEILEKPEIVRHFTDEQLKEAENIKAENTKKPFLKKLGDNFEFLFTYFKDKKEYENYTSKTYPEKERLNKALLKVNVSDEQLRKAKHLQEKAFMSFDKMDEMSQRYSEDMEAATEISKQVITNTFSLIFAGLMVGLAAAVAFGKMPWHRIGKLLSNITFKKGSGVRNFIDNAYGIINKNKELKKAFNKTLSPKVTDESKNLILQNPEISKLTSEASQKLIAKATNINPLQVIDFIQKAGFKIKPEATEAFLKALTSFEGKNTKDIMKLLDKSVVDGLIEFPADKSKLIELVKNSEIVKNTFNDNFFARWTRNILLECGIGYGRAKRIISGETLKTINNLMGKKNSSFYQTYKTIINTSAICAIPVIGTIIAVPYALCSWLTNIQKKAGKIGVMQAIKELDNDNLYVDKNYNGAETIEKQDKSENNNNINSNDMITNFLNRMNIRKSA